MGKFCHRYIVDIVRNPHGVGSAGQPEQLLCFHSIDDGRGFLHWF